ncbi:MAG: Ig-like domain-containing protein [Pseudomonadota bacterium]
MGVRRALLAALIFAALPASAGVEVSVSGEHLVVAGLEAQERATLLAHPERLILRVAGLNSARGTPVALSQAEGALRVLPRFPLRAGTRYALSLVLPHRAVQREVTLASAPDPAPRLTGVAPSQGTIPENTLRLYLTFSEPMARGHVRNTVALYRGDGRRVPNPFLTLANELWDPSHTRLTLLFDPGRIKQGVGPNAEVGPLLEQGETYRLVIAAEMSSAAGQGLGRDAEIVFRAGPPERRAISPAAWHVQPPGAGTNTPLTVIFDRIIDTGAGARLLRLTGPDGTTVRGTVTTDGGGWSLVPSTPWAPGRYMLAADPQLEDVSGNTVGAAFDAGPGTMGRRDSAARIAVLIE